MLADEDSILLDTLLIIATAPLWLGWLAWRIAVATWADWRRA